MLDFETDLIYYALEFYIHQFDKAWIDNNFDDYIQMVTVLDEYRKIVYDNTEE